MWPLLSLLAHRRPENARYLTSVALALATALVEATSLAQAQDGGEPPGYREAILEAVAEYEAQNYLEARSLFLKAHSILPNARTFRGLGVVSFELKQYSETITFLEQALASDVKRLDGQMRSHAERLLARAWTFVAQLDITLEPRDARVAVDGSEAGPLPERLLLDVGTHQLEFHAPGYQPVHRSISVVGAERRAWNISLSELDSSSMELARTPKPSHRIARGVGGSLIGLGGASFALAGVFMGQRRERGAALRGVPESTFNPGKLSAWQNSRGKVFLSAALGSAAATAGLIGLTLGAPRERIPWWASILAGLGGTGLLVWGAVDVVKGAPCDLSPRFQGRCTRPLQRRDRGAIVLLSSAPLLSVPLTQLSRRLFTPSEPNSNVAFTIRSSASPTSVVLDASMQWM